MRRKLVEAFADIHRRRLLANHAHRFPGKDARAGKETLRIHHAQGKQTQHRAGFTHGFVALHDCERRLVGVFVSQAVGAAEGDQEDVVKIEHQLAEEQVCDFLHRQRQAFAVLQRAAMELGVELARAVRITPMDHLLFADAQGAGQYIHIVLRHELVGDIRTDINCDPDPHADISCFSSRADFATGPGQMLFATGLNYANRQKRLHEPSPKRRPM